MLFALALYAVTVIAPTPASSDESASIALGRDGTVAVITGSTSGAFGGFGNAVLVVHRNGTRSSIPTPPDELGGFNRVRLGGDGTVAATIALQFPGDRLAGPQQTAWVRRNGAWARVFTGATLPAKGHNTVIAAVDDAASLVVVANFSSSEPDLSGAPKPLHFHEDEVAWRRGSMNIGLGFGDAFAVRGPYIAGRKPGFSPTMTPEPSSATLWVDAKPIRLGPGTASAVNAAGDAAGTDGVNPVLWRRKHAVRLTTLPGTAFGISDRGTIVGDAGGRAFVATVSRSRIRFAALDDRIRECGWHIVHAYGIASSGRIIAVGSRSGGASEVVVLDPMR